MLGGTFDPPHLGHLVIAQEALHQLGLDRLLVMPAAVPPHKRDREVTDGALRLEMARAAFGDVEGVEVSEVELRREGPSYTADPLRHQRAAHPDAALHLLLGADQVRELDTWREPEVVRSLATLVVFRRAGEEPALPGEGGGPVVPLEIPRLDISSTEIRRRVAAEEPIRFLVPDAVGSIIAREGLYR